MILSVTHTVSENRSNKVMIEPKNSPVWVYGGRTCLLLKKIYTKNPRNYWPITCLSTAISYRPNSYLKNLYW